jgi:hypothetical protein
VAVKLIRGHFGKHAPKCGCSTEPAAYCFPNDSNLTVVAVMPTKDNAPLDRDVKIRRASCARIAHQAAAALTDATPGTWRPPAP